MAHTDTPHDPTTYDIRHNEHIETHLKLHDLPQSSSVDPSYQVYEKRKFGIDDRSRHRGSISRTPSFAVERQAAVVVMQHTPSDLKDFLCQESTP